MKKIILGVSSSISAYKAYDLSRLFVKGGYTVFAVLTDHAMHLVNPLTFETLTGNPVYSNAHSWERREMGHIELKDNAALFLVAPATANIMAKFAHGIADDLLSTTYLAATCPMLLAPAMNPNMYNHWATQENMTKLKSRGVNFIEPGDGLVACGDEGIGRLAEIEDIYNRAREIMKDA